MGYIECDFSAATHPHQNIYRLLTFPLPPSVTSSLDRMHFQSDNFAVPEFCLEYHNKHKGGDMIEHTITISDNKIERLRAQRPSQRSDH